LPSLQDAGILIRDLEPFRQARPVWDRAAEMILAPSGSALCPARFAACNDTKWKSRTGVHALQNADRGTLARSAAPSESTAPNGVARVLAFPEELLVAHDRRAGMEGAAMLHIGLRPSDARFVLPIRAVRGCHAWLASGIAPAVPTSTAVTCGFPNALRRLVTP
jgi:hypothetical protein